MTKQQLVYLRQNRNIDKLNSIEIEMNKAVVHWMILYTGNKNSNLIFQMRD
jgi:hypothetical protein